MKDRRRFIKASLIVFIIVILSVLGILYFTYPVKIQNVLKHTDDIERIHVNYYSNGNSSEYLLTKYQGIDFSEAIQIFNSVTYTRKLNTFRGGTGDAFFMTIVYREKDGEINSYFVDIRELGILISDKKEYRIHGKSNELISMLVDWIKSH